MKTQIAHMVSGDLFEGTLTFNVVDKKGMFIQSGKYAIVPFEEYKKITNIDTPHMEIFKTGQSVIWGKLNYWVVEDNGDSKILITNSNSLQHHEYQDLWVNRSEICCININDNE